MHRCWNYVFALCCVALIVSGAVLAGIYRKEMETYNANSKYHKTDLTLIARGVYNPHGTSLYYGMVYYSINVRNDTRYCGTYYGDVSNNKTSLEIEMEEKYKINSTVTGYYTDTDSLLTKCRLDVDQSFPQKVYVGMIFCFVMAGILFLKVLCTWCCKKRDEERPPYAPVQLIERDKHPDTV